MRIFHMAAIAVALIALAGSASAVAQSSDLLDAKDKAFGYVDLKTGMFHPVTAVDASPETTTTTTRTATGTLEVSIVTTIASTTTLPKGTAILCDVTMSGTVGVSNYSQVASSAATVSAGKATCTVNIPYSWTGIDTGTTGAAFYVANYKVTATSVSSATQPITDFNVVAQVNGPVTLSSTSSPVALPANGSVTKYTVDATI